MKNRINPFLGTLVVIAMTQAAARANPYWWDTTTTGTWATPGNWWTTAGGTVSGVAPGALDDVTFNGTGVNGATIVQLDADTSVNGMTFANTNTTTINSSDTTTRVLTLGTGGITVNAGAGIVTLGDATNNVNLVLGPDATAASYTFANNNTIAANTLIVKSAITGGTTGTAGAKILNVSTAGGGITLSGAITNGGATSLALNFTNSSSTLTDITLSGGTGNTYTGGTSIGDKVRLNVTTGNSLGGSAGLITVSSGGMLWLNSTNTVANNLNISGNGGGGSGAGAIRMGNGTNIINGNITLSGNSAIGVDSGRSATINGNITGAGGLEKVSTGVSTGSPLTLTGINDYSGATTITQGVISFAKQASLYNSVTTNWTPTKISVASGAALALGVGASASGYWDAAGVTAFLGASQMGGSTTTTGFKTGSLIGFDTTNATSGTFTYGAIGNIGTSTLNGVVKLGTGTLVLNAANTYTGATNVEGGTLNLASTGVINGTTASVSNGTFALNGTLNGTTLTINPGGTFSNAGGTATFSGAASFGNGSSNFAQSSGTSSFVSLDTSNTQDFGLINITGGDFTVASFLTLRRSSSGAAPTLASPTAASTTSGLYVNGSSAVVKLGSLNIGTANSSASARVNNGSVTVAGAVTVGKTTSTSRWDILQVSGGTFTAANTTNGIILAPNNGLNINNAELYLSGGTTTAGRIGFGASTDTVGGNGFLILGGGTLYVGSGGIVKASTIGAYNYTVGLTSGTIGAVADWSSSLNMTLGTNPTIRAADSEGNARNITLSGNLTGVGFTKTGAGKLTLSGATNGFTGGITVSGGTLAVSGAGKLTGATGLSVASNATFAHAPTTAGTVLTLGAASTLTLADKSTIAETFGSSITALGAATVGTNTVNLNFTGTFSSGSTYTVLTAASGLGAGNYKPINTNYTYSLTKAAGSVTITPTTATALTTAYWKGGSTLGAGIWAASDGSAATPLTNWTTDSAGAIKSTVLPGAGTNVVFSATGASNQGGMTLGANLSINSLTVNGTGATPNETNAITLASTDGYNLTLGSTTSPGITVNTGSAAVTLNPDINMGIAQSWTNNSASPLTIGGAVNNGGFLLTSTGTGNTAISGAINGSGGLTKSGAGTLTLSGANTYTGATTISAGKILNGSATTFTSKGALSMSSTGIFDLGGFDAEFTNVSASATSNLITNNGASNATLTESLQTSTISSIIADGSKTLGFKLINNNSSAIPFLLSSANTFSGGLTLAYDALNASGGTRLRINAAVTTVGSPGAITSSPFGTGAITVGLAATDKAQILLDTVNSITLANDIIINTARGTDSTMPIGIRVDTASNILSGKITANLANATFGVKTGASVSLTGQITGSSGLDIYPGTTGYLGTVTLNNAGTANNYAGNTTVGTSTYNSVLALGAANQIPNGSGKGNVIVNGTLNLGGFSETINGLSGGSTGTVDGVSGTPTLTVGDNGATGASNTFAGVIKNTAGTLSLTKVGNGTLTLSGTNTYTGETKVDEGTLVVNGSVSTSITTTVASGATLAGNGTVGAATINGILAPGNSIGTITANGDVTWNDNDAWVFELGSAASTLALAGSGNSIQDMLNITGAGSDFFKGTGSSFTFNFSNTGAVGFYKLVDWTGTTTFDYGVNGDFVATNLTSGLTGTFTVDNDSQALYLTVIPEPRAALLGGLGMLALLRRRRA